MNIQTLKEKIDKLDPQAHKALRDFLTAEYNRLAGERGNGAGLPEKKEKAPAPQK